MLPTAIHSISVILIRIIHGARAVGILITKIMNESVRLLIKFAFIGNSTPIRLLVNSSSIAITGNCAYIGQSFRRPLCRDINIITLFPVSFISYFPIKHATNCPSSA